MSAELRQKIKNHKSYKKSSVCHNLATWRCIFAAQLKIYKYEYRFECKGRSTVDADSVD